MTMLVDTSVWSLALRHDGRSAEPTVVALHEALLGSEAVVTTGLVLQELLQGFSGPKAAAAIVERFRALPMIQPKSGSYPDAGNPWTGLGGPMIGAIRSLM
jgi:predicted nucleic acid-binding protein